MITFIYGLLWVKRECGSPWDSNWPADSMVKRYGEPCTMLAYGNHEVARRPSPLSVSDISQPLSKWQYIYLPIGENWNQRNRALVETVAAGALMLKWAWNAGKSGSRVSVSLWTWKKNPLEHFWCNHGEPELSFCFLLFIILITLNSH